MSFNAYWFGFLACQIVPKITYYVSGGMLLLIHSLSGISEIIRDVTVSQNSLYKLAFT